MKQHYPLDPVTGIENPLLAWVNGNPSTGASGSFPPFGLFVDPQAEILATQRASGLTDSPDGTDTAQVAQAIARGTWLGTLGQPATVNDLTGGLLGGVSFPALVVGMEFSGVIASGNAGAMTVTLSGFKAPPGKLNLVSKGGLALVQGDAPANLPFKFWFDGTQFRMSAPTASDIAAGAAAVTRLRLTGNLTLYANSTIGDDTTGTGTQAKPFATPTAAYAYALAKLDLAGFTLTISCAGAFTTGVAVNGLLPGQVSPLSVTFDGGGSATITSVGSCFYAGAGAAINVQNFGPLSSTGTGYAQGCALLAIGGATIVFNGITVAACAVAHLAPQSGGTILSRNIITPGTAVTLTVTGSAPGCLNSGLQGTLYVNGITINIPSNVNFSYAFASAFQGNLQAAGIVFTGGAVVTGRRFYIDGFGYIFVNGAGVNYFPGSIAGAINGSEGDYR